MAEVQDARGPLRVTEVRRTQDALIVRYSLHGEGKVPVWVLDGLFRTSRAGYPTLAPERAYVEGKDGVLVLSRALLPVPRNKRVESPEVPCARKLSPGETLTGEIRVPLPPEEDLPYSEPQPLELSTLRSVKLRVGYIEDVPELRLHESKDTQGRVCHTPSYGEAITRQQVAEVGPLPIPGPPTP